MSGIITKYFAGQFRSATSFLKFSMFDLVSKSETQPYVSYLRHINTRGVLSQHMVTDWESYATFKEFAADFPLKASYRKPQLSKYETYSFTPTLFEESNWVPKNNPTATPQWGHWRSGAASAHAISVMYLDCDNARDDCDRVTIDQIATLLKSLNLSHVLYTSFSHTAVKHKVRVLMPLSRSVTYPEAAKLFMLFNWMFSYQLDAAIYDDGDHLYGPPYNSEYRDWTDGYAIDVDTCLRLAKELPEEAKAASKATEANSARTLTPVERQESAVLMASYDVREDVSIRNPVIFNPAWMNDLIHLRNGGSHRMTLLSVLTKCFVKSGHTLTFGELRSLQDDLDWEAWNGYCANHYPRHELERDVRSVLNFRGSGSIAPLSPKERRNAALKREMKRWAKKRA
jgi:hypothetical protein